MLVALALQCAVAQKEKRTDRTFRTDLRSAKERDNRFDGGDQTSRVGGEEDNKCRQKNEAPFFEFGDASIGFAGLCVNRFEFFINAVETLLAAVRQIVARFCHFRFLIEDFRFHSPALNGWGWSLNSGRRS